MKEHCISVFPFKGTMKQCGSPLDPENPTTVKTPKGYKHGLCDALDRAALDTRPVRTDMLEAITQIKPTGL